MAQENKELEKKIEELEAKNKEYLEGWKRERAEFLNYKKEEMERISGIIKYCSEETILKILPILDNFYIAEREMEEDLKNHKWSEGFLNIKQQISEFLKSQGIEEIEAIGEKFDPNTMEATEETEEIVGSQTSNVGSLTSNEAGTVIEEIQKGYTLNGKVIRPARVKISK